MTASTYEKFRLRYRVVRLESVKFSNSRLVYSTEKSSIDEMRRETGWKV